MSPRRRDQPWPPQPASPVPVVWSPGQGLAPSRPPGAAGRAGGDPEVVPAPCGVWGDGEGAFPAPCPARPRPRSGQLCEMPPRAAGQPGPCERAECQNGAACVERGARALCQCLPGFGGPKCEKLLSVNFVDRDTYLQFTDLQDWPRANITLQVRARGRAGCWGEATGRGVPPLPPPGLHG